MTGLIAVALALCAPSHALAKRPQQPGVYTVPSAIKSNCSAPVDDKITAWLQTVPDNSTVQFGPGRCYGQAGTITLPGRNGLVIDGRGAEFRALTTGDSHRSNWRFVGGSNITVQNLAVRGSDPQGAYDETIQWQHGFSIEGVQGMTLTNVQARETWGDGIDLWRSSPSPACGDDASSARNVVIDGATLERNGRQGLAVVDAELVTLRNSTIGPVAWWSVDLETDDDCEIARYVTIDHNSFGANRYGVLGSVGFGGSPQVGHVTFTNNVQTAPTGLPGECWAPVWVLSPDGLSRDDYTFAGNTLLARRNAFEFRRLNNVTVNANTVTFDTASNCGTRSGVLLVGSHVVTITDNAFTGADRVYSADTTDITATGNTL
jgi:Right handed beta helix region